MIRLVFELFIDKARGQGASRDLLATLTFETTLSWQEFLPADRLIIYQLSGRVLMLDAHFFTGILDRFFVIVQVSAFLSHVAVLVGAVLALIQRLQVERCL